MKANLWSDRADDVGLTRLLKNNGQVGAGKS